MRNNYRQLAQNIRSRTNPESIILEKSFSDELSSLSYSDVATFIRMAMRGVEPAYTQASKDAGEAVKTHLRRVLAQAEYKFQGSVMTNTHIKGYSDIDLLVISEKFYQPSRTDIDKWLTESYLRNSLSLNEVRRLENENANFSTYQGNAIEDLKLLRVQSERELTAQYSICDIRKPKCIKIKNLHYNREVDTVIANWYDDALSIAHDRGEERGVQIYNKDTHSRENADFPFISIKKINERGVYTNGRIKRMIRLLKNIKEESDLKIELSSFDINALCYDINPEIYRATSFLGLVPIVYNQLYKIVNDQEHRDSIVSVDGREYIFRYKSDKIENLQKIMTEFGQLYSDTKKTFAI
jgi:hypothetical protein